MPSTFRFLRHFLRPAPDAVAAEETTYRRAGEALPASLYLPAGSAGSSAGLPGWVALHGLTHSARKHESLVAFARALAASGAAVLVPEVPEWRALHPAPGTAVETIKAAVLELDGRRFTAAGRVGVIGFSFGGTQALIASADPALAGRLAAVASWGAYADLRRAVRFLFVGDHELDGETFHDPPDPYGRWILAGNYLTLVPELAGADDLADALLGLARETGRRRIMAWEPATDPLKEEARRALGDGEREVFDLLAPPAAAVPTAGQRQRMLELAGRLTDAMVDREPLLDPAPFLGRVRTPVFLAHGREDRLLPWTELVRLRRALPADRVRHALVTGLFAHSFRERWLPTPAVVVEAVRFIRAINRMVRLV